MTGEPRHRLSLLAGYILFGIGLVGVVLPLLPTVIFWIGAAACFARSSPAMRRRISQWPRFGRVVDDFLEQGAIDQRNKALAIVGMAIGLLIAALILGPGLLFAGTAVLIALAALYVLTRPQPRTT